MEMMEGIEGDIVLVQSAPKHSEDREHILRKVCTYAHVIKPEQD